MKKAIAAILCVLSIAGLAACGGTSSTAKETPYKKPTTAQPSQTAKPKLSERGNIIKHIGDKAGVSKAPGSTVEMADWTVTNIIIDPKCTSPDAMPSANGHYVEFDVNAATTSDFDEDNYGTLTIGIPDVWQYVQKDGTQWNGKPGGNASSCMTETEQFPSSLGQSIKASGKIVFDVPSTDGILVYSDGSNGWEYPLS